MEEDVNSEQCLTIKGLVSSGRGEGKSFVSLPWFREYVKRKFNFDPLPGTLNIIVSGEDSRTLKEKFKCGGFMVPSRENYFPGRLYRALIACRVEGAVVRPETPKYPENLIEIIAPVCLRRILDIRDGDEIEVKIFFG